jgi:hypothetical protein
MECAALSGALAGCGEMNLRLVLCLRIQSGVAAAALQNVHRA